MAATSQFDPALAVMHGSEGLEVTMAFKAQGVAVPHLCIAATQVMPDYRPNADLGAHAQLHVTDAQNIVKALYESLPGGTLDQILRLLLERKASQLVVRF